MRRVMLPLLMFAVAACQPQAGPLSDEDVAAINAALQSFQEAALAGDVETAVLTYTEDAVFMPFDQPMYEGRAAEMDHLESGPPVVSFSWSAAAVEGVGALAYGRGPYTVSVLMGADTVSMQGKWLGVFEKQLDGTWQMAVECWNLDAPLPPTEAP
jgi:ketosteroid isomerase-like protein